VAGLLIDIKRNKLPQGVIVNESKTIS